VNSPLRTMNNYQYRVIVSGTCTPSVTSNAVVLTVNTKPEITAQPVDITICQNTNTFFQVTAQGTALIYQWYVDTGSGFAAVANGGVYSGATSNKLNLTNVPVSYDGYIYQVQITGTCPPVATSSSARLGVSVSTSITLQPRDTTVCEFNAASFKVNAYGAGLTYKWQLYTGGIWTNLTPTANYTGVTTSTLVIYNPTRTFSANRYRVIVGKHMLC